MKTAEPLPAGWLADVKEKGRLGRRLRMTQFSLERKLPPRLTEVQLPSPATYRRTRTIGHKLTFVSSGGRMNLPSPPNAATVIAAEIRTKRQTY